MPLRTGVCVLLTVLPLAASTFQYPPAPRGNVVDNYNGVLVPDPYRSLENPDSPSSRQWITAENALTHRYLSTVTNTAALTSRLTQLWNPVEFPPGQLFVRGDRYFFLRRDSGKNQPVLYWMDGRQDKPRVILDPNALSSNGTAALESWSVSHDGKTLAYGIARAGSDWQDIRFRSVDDARDLPDKLEWTKFSTPEWNPADDGVYYTRYPKPAEGQLLRSANLNQQLCFHKMGAQQTNDAVVYQRPDHNEWRFGPEVSDDGAYLILSIYEGTRPENQVYFQDLKKKGSRIEPLVDRFEAQYGFLGNRGKTFYFQTTKDAPKARVISLGIGPGHQLSQIVAQKEDALDNAVLVGDTLYLGYQKDATSRLVVTDVEGHHARDVNLPGKGSANWADHGPKGSEQFFWFGSFTQPNSLYSFDSKTGQNAAFGASPLPFNPREFETRQVFYQSKDGTRIPMFLIGRAGFKSSPDTPCLLYGYGGFDISLNPSYAPLYLMWAELGGVVAVANLRGGGEYGEAWHQAGMKLKKQNVFDDFIAAGEWLIANHYTSTPKLGIYGRSNGGLLIGAVLNQRPDLFGAAVPGVGVMDMLRFNKFTVGGGWTADYGSPENPAEFKAIRAYSPLHNIREGGHYPPTLVLTADHDDRVVSAHSFKYTAALQHAQASDCPILIRIETEAGHGGGKPIAKRVDEAVAILAFFEKTLHMAGQ